MPNDFYIRYEVDTPGFYLSVGMYIVTDSRGPWSKCFVCPECGELWARIHGSRSWIAVMRNCRSHNGGSLIDDTDPYYIDAYPRELLAYEVMVWQNRKVKEERE